MTVFSFDLEDGKKPVSLHVHGDDTERLIDFLSKYHQLEQDNEEITRGK